MPRIWIDYCQFLIDQKLITKTRHCFDLALKSLPVTQHDKIWEIYIKWAESLPLSQTAILIYKRYLRLNPDAREDFINYLISIKKFDEAMTNIIDILNDTLFHSKKGKSKFELWLLLCEIISKYPDKVVIIFINKEKLRL
jgi:pre-mRNA-splicing factor SYF1